jgi:hypothetical protein
MKSCSKICNHLFVGAPGILVKTAHYEKGHARHVQIIDSPDTANVLPNSCKARIKVFSAQCFVE